MKGFIGIDEVGRGPLAGPVTVCAFYLDKKHSIYAMFPKGLKDSKKLNKEKREEIFKQVKKEKMIFIVSSRSAEHIDKHGIVSSINACINSCIVGLEKKGIDTYKTPIKLDGGLKLPKEFKKQSTHIKGDENFPEIALASICAKVTRDRYMCNLAKKFPKYFWYENVGYGTKKHREAIKKHKPTKFHRKSFLKNI